MLVTGEDQWDRARQRWCRRRIMHHRDLHRLRVLADPFRQRDASVHHLLLDGGSLTFIEWLGALVGREPWIPDPRDGQPRYFYHLVVEYHRVRLLGDRVLSQRRDVVAPDVHVR